MQHTTNTEETSMSTSTTTPTTRRERAPRIAQIAYDHNSPAIQALLELGVAALEEQGPDALDGLLTAGEPAYSLEELERIRKAASVIGATHQGAPQFAIGDLVEILDELDQPSGYFGAIEERYISARGTWEYRVRYSRRRGARRYDSAGNYRERELTSA
jgi:hypothetical protein